MDWMKQLISRYPELETCAPQIEQAYSMLRACYQSGGKVLVCGNGGSAADSEHIVGELMKGFMLKRPVAPVLRQKLYSDWPEQGAYLADHLQGGLPAISLVSHSALVFAFNNDVASDMVFAQQVNGYGRPGDVLWGISASGNAVNVANAVRVARSLGLKTLGLTGMTGGLLKTVAEVTICVPGGSVPEVQERHLPVYHTLCQMLEEAFFS